MSRHGGGRISKPPPSATRPRLQTNKHGHILGLARRRAPSGVTYGVNARPAAPQHILYGPTAGRTQARAPQGPTGGFEAAGGKAPGRFLSPGAAWYRRRKNAPAGRPPRPGRPRQKRGATHPGVLFTDFTRLYKWLPWGMRRHAAMRLASHLRALGYRVRVRRRRPRRGPCFYTVERR